MFTGINHISIATRDLDRTIRVWSDKYGVGPWAAYTFDPSNMSAVVGGRPALFRMRVGFCEVGPSFAVELIQPLDERSPYAEALAKRGGADHVHHISLEVSDFREAAGRLGRNGLDETMEATFDGGAGAESECVGVYFATESDLGFVLEVSHVPPGFTLPQPDYVYPTGA